MHACRMAGAEPVFRDQSLYRDSWYLAAGDSLRSVVLLFVEVFSVGGLLHNVGEWRGWFDSMDGSMQRTTRHHPSSRRGADRPHAAWKAWRKLQNGITLGSFSTGGRGQLFGGVHGRGSGPWTGGIRDNSFSFSASISSMCEWRNSLRCLS